MKPDYNLLTALDVPFAEGSAPRAARRLQLSRSAMSRTLARLRETTGDPLLVRAGRGLILMPRALQLREKTGCELRGVTDSDPPDLQPAGAGRRGPRPLPLGKRKLRLAAWSRFQDSCHRPSVRNLRS
jgi:hypothetical protein